MFVKETQTAVYMYMYLVASNEHVRLQCDIIMYLEVSSADYLFASDKRVCVQLTVELRAMRAVLGRPTRRAHL